MKFGKLEALALFAAAVAPTSAEAAVFQAEIKGTVSHATDNLSLFGGGTLPQGTPWTMVFTFDDAAPGGLVTTVPSSSSSLSATTAGVIAASFNWGGTTYTFGSKGGEIIRAASPGFGEATFIARGSNTGADDGSVTVSLVQYSSSTPLTATDFRAPLDVTGLTGPYIGGRFEAVNETPGIRTRTAFALDVTSVKVSALSTTSAVPEPATWAMMLIGFGAIGGTMRRRKTSARIQFA